MAAEEVKAKAQRKQKDNRVVEAATNSDAELSDNDEAVQDYTYDSAVSLHIF